MSKEDTLSIDLAEAEANPEVQQFLNEMRDQNKKEETPQVDPEEIKEKLFDQEQESLFRETLIDTSTVEVTDEEKKEFLRAVLFDNPVEFEVESCAGNIKAGMRTRTNFEQQIIFAALEVDMINGIIPQDTTNFVMQMQKYAATLMVTSFGGKPLQPFQLETPDFVGTEEIKKAVKILQGAKSKKIDTQNMVRWTSILNSLRIFEAKIAIMSAQVLNENFWKTED